jgi:hypothetical protein
MTWFWDYYSETGISAMAFPCMRRENPVSSDQ